MSATFPKLLLLRETWGHMSGLSGFDPLFAELQRMGGGAVQSVQVTGRDKRRKRSLGQKIARRFGMGSDPLDGLRGESPTPWAYKVQEVAGGRLLDLARRHADAKIVLSVAENQYGKVLSQAGPEIRRRMYLCFHQPPSWMRLYWRDFAALEGVAGLFCLGRDQQRYLQSVCGAPVHPMPHGVTVDFFTPPAAVREEGPARLLFVGKWLRDFETLRRAMPMIWSRRPDVELDCVIPMKGREDPNLLELAKDGRVRWHAGLSPEDLRSLYQRATLLFLPLTDAVANNSVVEALACGLPVVTSDVGDAGEYAGRAGVMCRQGSAEDHAENVLHWLGRPDLRREAEKAARDFAEHNLRWEMVAERMVRRLGGADV